MRKIAGFTLAVALVFAACENDDNNNPTPAPEYNEVTVNMGTNSSNDVYYSLSDGTVKTVERKSWDIAFSVPLHTATILINEGAGVELYPAGDTADWEIIDTNTIAGVQPYFNDKADWNKGAFNYSATGHPNYGWGTYHGGDPDNNVGGDSAYVIKLSDGSYKKFMVIAKLGEHSANYFRIANLDGSNEFTDTVSTEPFYEQQHFVYYSIVNKSVVEVEPGMNNWDLLFTRYIVKYPSGPSTFMNYPVMGVLNNPDVKAAKFEGQDPEKYAEIPAAFGSEANIIGSDWKLPDQNHVIHLVDSTGYFIRTKDQKIYQLYFTNYGSYESGRIDLKVRELE